MNTATEATGYPSIDAIPSPAGYAGNQSIHNESLADIARRACYYFIASRVRIETARGHRLEFNLHEGDCRASFEDLRMEEDEAMPLMPAAASRFRSSAHENNTTYVQSDTGACELRIDLQAEDADSTTRICCIDIHARRDWELLDQDYVAAISHLLARILAHRTSLERMRHQNAGWQLNHLENVLDEVDALVSVSDQGLALLEVFLLSPEQEWLLSRTLGVREARLLEEQLHGRLIQLLPENAQCYHRTSNSALIIARGLTQQSAEQFAVGLSESLARPVSSLSATDITPEVCIGLACLAAMEREPAGELFRRASMAANLAYTGNSGWAAYNAEVDHVQKRMERLSRDLPLALKAQDQLFLVYQPQVSLTDFRCRRVEALLRWNHPEFGHVNPAEIVRAVEGLPLMRKLSDWVLDSALEQLAAWRRQGIELSVSVNMSAVDFSGGCLSDRVGAALDHHGLSGDALEIEFTETLLVRDFQKSVNEIIRLQTLGVSVAVDDFGTGYSNLNQLLRMPVNTLKIDRSFVQEDSWDARSASILRGVIGIARELGVTTVAEGMETSEICSAVSRCGCDVAQGYLFRRPARAADLESELMEAGVVFLPSEGRAWDWPD